MAGIFREVIGFYRRFVGLRGMNICNNVNVADMGADTILSQNMGSALKFKVMLPK